MVWRHLLNSNPSLVPTSARSLNYDPDNGQVFTETSLTVPSMLSSWTTTTIGSLCDVTNFKNSEGADSLEQIALRSILANLNDLDVETLSCVPWTVGKRIWEYIMRVRFDSFRTWKMFVLAYPEARDMFNTKTHKVALSDMRQRVTLPEIVKQISAPNFEWISHLSVKDLGDGITTAEWANLSKLSNLGTLQVIGTAEGSNLNDRVLRAWSEEARASGAFSHLRVAMLLNILGITNASFRHLHALPAIRLCTLDGCETNYLDSVGWEPVPGHCHMVVACGLIFTQRDSPDDYYRRTFSHDYALPKERAPHEPPVVSLRSNLSGQSYRLYSCPLLERIEMPDLLPAAAESTVRAQEPEAKKRKLRETRTQRLDDVLGAFGV